MFMLPQNSLSENDHMTVKSRRKLVRRKIALKVRKCEMLRNIVLLGKYSNLLDHLTKRADYLKGLKIDPTNAVIFAGTWREGLSHQADSDKCIFSLQKKRTVNSSRYRHKNFILFF